ncbi:MAG: hypothetical protein GF309_16775 [Candidatus Lokiarchaeota archaeon]|nr:hypothetical protein [Candidatus Lokiarchaeota archaeon]
MRYVGEETIDLPMSVSREDIQSHIDVWLETPHGRQYEILARNRKSIRMKRSWLDEWCQIHLTVSVISGIIATAFGVLTPFFLRGELIGLLPLAGIAVFFISIPVIYHVFSHKIIITVHIQESNIDFRIDATNKQEAAKDFDTVIKTVRNSISQDASSLNT